MFEIHDAIKSQGDVVRYDDVPAEFRPTSFKTEAAARAWLNDADIDPKNVVIVSKN